MRHSEDRTTLIVGTASGVGQVGQHGGREGGVITAGRRGASCTPILLRTPTVWSSIHTILRWSMWAANPRPFFTAVMEVPPGRSVRGFALCRSRHTGIFLPHVRSTYGI